MLRLIFFLNWQEIYQTGGRKFALINLPALGCIPAIRILEPGNNGRCLEEVSLLAALHNKALSKLLFQMKKKLKGFEYALFDLKSSLQQRMKHPSKFGMCLTISGSFIWCWPIKLSIMNSVVIILIDKCGEFSSMMIKNWTHNLLVP